VSDTQIPSCLPDGQQHFQFSALPEVRHGRPIMTNLLFARGRSSMDAYRISRNEVTSGSALVPFGHKGFGDGLAVTLFGEPL
jgi:hypothetical protein